MKILVISSDFPPDHSGGYQIRIKNIVDRLSQKGHHIQVLTTISEKKNKTHDNPLNYPVIRKLHKRYLAKFFPKEVLFDLLDTRTLENSIETFNPDLIYLGHNYILSKALLPLLARKKIPILFDEGGKGLANAWEEHGRWFQFTGDYASQYRVLNTVKPWVIKLVCRSGQGRIEPTWSWPGKITVICNSQPTYQNVIDHQIDIKDIVLIHSGIDLELFTHKPRAAWNPPIKIICPGMLVPRKGQVDAVQLLAALKSAAIDAHLIIVGKKVDLSYHAELLEMIKTGNLEEDVEILPMLPQAELVGLYQQADVCFFPSYQELGFSRTSLEAMACGCIVFSYGNEGSSEIINHGQNGFLVQPGDNINMIEVINSLLDNPKQVMAITSQARQEIETHHSMRSYINKVDEIIRKAAAQREIK